MSSTPHDARCRTRLLLPTLCVALTLLAGLTLSGCGNKGPLYLPEAAPITEVGSGEPGEAPEQPDAQEASP